MIPIITQAEIEYMARGVMRIGHLMSSDSYDISDVVHALQCTGRYWDATSVAALAALLDLPIERDGQDFTTLEYDQYLHDVHSDLIDELDGIEDADQRAYVARQPVVDLTQFARRPQPDPQSEVERAIIELGYDIPATDYPGVYEYTTVALALTAIAWDAEQAIAPTAQRFGWGEYAAAKIGEVVDHIERVYLPYQHGLYRPWAIAPVQGLGARPDYLWYGSQEIDLPPPSIPRGTTNVRAILLRDGLVGLCWGDLTHTTRWYRTSHTTPSDRDACRAWQRYVDLIPSIIEDTYSLSRAPVGEELMA